jgi:hypothetical protein
MFFLQRDIVDYVLPHSVFINLGVIQLQTE